MLAYSPEHSPRLVTQRFIQAEDRVCGHFVNSLARIGERVNQIFLRAQERAGCGVNAPTPNLRYVAPFISAVRFRIYPKANHTCDGIYKNTCRLVWLGIGQWSHTVL